MNAKSILIKGFGSLLIAALLFAAFPMGEVKANFIASATIVFESQLGYSLTDNLDGTYSGVIPCKVDGGFDVFAKEGAEAYIDGSTVTISEHDAWDTWAPDTPDWYQYSLSFYVEEGVQKWALRNHAGATETEPWYSDDTPAMGVPMSGTMHWENMYAEESDVGAYLPGTGTAKSLGTAEANGGGPAYWDMDWSWGSEVVPLEYPGFDVQIEDLGSGNFKVTLSPAEGPVKNLTTNITYGSIQSAIDAASEGDTIEVAAGTYTATSLESIVIATDGISIIGESRDGTIIDAGAWGTSNEGWPKGIQVKADDVTIKNLTVQGFTGDTTSTGGYGILFRDYDHDTTKEGLIYYSGGTVENVKLQDNYSALYSLVHQTLTVTDSLIQNNLSDRRNVHRPMVG